MSDMFIIALTAGVALGVGLGTLFGVLIKFNEFEERFKKLEDKDEKQNNPLG